MDQDAGKDGNVSGTLSLNHDSPCGLLDIHPFNRHWSRIKERQEGKGRSTEPTRSQVLYFVFNRIRAWMEIGKMLSESLLLTRTLQQTRAICTRPAKMGTLHTLANSSQTRGYGYA